MCLHRPPRPKAVRSADSGGRTRSICWYVFHNLAVFLREWFSQIPGAGEHLELDPLKVVGLECDVSSEVSVAKAFTRTFEVFGRVDAVVASAGMLVCHLDHAQIHYRTENE